ncbi:YdiK family protein [Oceanobacillus iheyensis]|uniref:YdiK family protein n=1 Tax=Oceanobacillus iheyensis TaxID=182710 RepID=UPI003643C570
MKHPFLTRAVLYFLVGIAFIYFGVQSKESTVWNSVTLIFAAVSALCFFVSFKMIGYHNKLRKKK